MAKRKTKSVYDLTMQANRIRSQYGNDPRVNKAESNEVRKRLQSFGDKGQMMIDVSKVSDSDYTGQGYSVGNTAQRLYNMANAGNKDAKRMLYSRNAKGGVNG